MAKPKKTAKGKAKQPAPKDDPSWNGMGDARPPQPWATDGLPSIPSFLNPKNHQDTAFDRLNPQRQIFVLEYQKDFNGAQAAIRAGYSEKTARSIASELLTFPDVKQAIQDQVEARHVKLNIEADDILREIAIIAYGDLSQVMTWGEHELTIREGDIKYDKKTKKALRDEDGEYVREPDVHEYVPVRARLKAPYEMGSKVKLLAEVSEEVTIRSIKHKFKMHDKMKALELLAKHKRLISDKVELEAGESLESLILAATNLEKKEKGKK